MKQKNLKLKFLKDAPVLKEEASYYNFYHDYISPALHEISTKHKGIHTIGLFGQWGSGKSTVIENLKKDYKDTPLFLFDAWKYKGDPLRRTFLIELLTFARGKPLWKKGKKLDESWLDELYEDTSISKEEEIPEEEQEKNFFKRIKNIIQESFRKRPIFSTLVATGFVGLILWVTAQQKLGENYPLIHFFLQFVGIVMGISGLTAFVVVEGSKTAIQIFTKWVLDDLKGEVHFQTVLKKRDHLNSPEQFEKKFGDLLSRLSKDIVIVFDNIDRVQGDTAIEILSSIKTFFNPRESKNVVFIIPCDSKSIEEQIKKYYDHEKIENFDASEYLRKLFNVILWPPEFIDTDLEDYTIKLLKQISDAPEIVKNDGLLRVVNYAFRSNPREIKQFLNNLVGSLMIASNADKAVWEEIKNHIDYLAKTIVIKQKFPKAYNKLKDSHFEPENILDAETDHKRNAALRDFMVNTNIITVPNAEPYLYFKLPNSHHEIDRSTDLVSTLIVEDLEMSKKIILDNQEKIDLVANFVSTLYGTYKRKPEWLIKIIKTFLLAISDLKLTITINRFWNKTAESLERDAWQEYKILSVDLVFEQLIRRIEVNKHFRDKLIERYISVLGGEEVVKDIQLARKILENFVLTKKLGEANNDVIKQTIYASYSQSIDIMSLFKTLNSQQRFVSQEAIKNYIISINLNTFQDNFIVLYNYKEFIHIEKLGDSMINALNPLISQNRSTYRQHSEQKELFYKAMEPLITEPFSPLNTAGQETRSSFGNELLADYAGGGHVDTKGYILKAMYRANAFLDETFRNHSVNYLKEFLLTTSMDSLKSFLTLLEKDESKTIISEFTSIIVDRYLDKEIQEFNYLFEIMNTSVKQVFINYYITQKQDFGWLTFVKGLPDLNERTVTISNVLDKITKIPATNEKALAYQWINEQIKPNDEPSLKNEVVTQIKVLLKTNEYHYNEVGLILLQGASYLNEERKRNIADDLIEFLKTPGRTISVLDKARLQALSFLYNDLLISKKIEFVDILFQLLNIQNEKDLLNIALEQMHAVNITWRDHKDSFVKLKEEISLWTNIENKKHLLSELIKFKSNRLSKEEKNYWNDIGTMLQAA